MSRLGMGIGALNREHAVGGMSLVSVVWLFPFGIMRLETLTWDLKSVMCSLGHFPRLSPSESCETISPRRALASGISKATMPERLLPNESSQVEAPNRKLPSEISRRNLPSDCSYWKDLPRSFKPEQQAPPGRPHRCQARELFQ